MGWFDLVYSCDKWEHRWICSSNILLTAALYLNCDILGIYFNSQYVTEGKILKCKTLRIDILGPVELQSNDESFSIRVTNCVQPEFSCRISCFSLISSKCSFLLCGYITFSPKEWGETLPGGTDPTPRVPPRLGKVPPWWPGANPGVLLGCTQQDLDILPGEWMVVGIRVTCLKSSIYCSQLTHKLRNKS